MKRTISITQKFIIFVSIFLVLVAADLWFYISGAKGLERYAAVNNILSSIKSDIVALEYAADIFIVAGDFEKGYGTEDVKDKAAVIDNDIAQLEKLPLASIFGDNISLPGEYGAFMDDWKSAKEKIGVANKVMSREEAMLIHNDIDIKAFLLRQRLERIDKFISDERAKAVSDVKNMAIYGFIFSGVIIFIVAYIFYRKTLKPIKALVATATPFASPHSLDGRDEIDTLSNILNAISDTANRTHAELEKDIAGKIRELETEAKECAALNRVAGLASRTLAQEEITGAALDELMLVMEADAGWVYLTEQQSGNLAAKLRLNVHRGVSHAFIREAKEIRPEDSGIVGGQIKNKKNVIINAADIEGGLRGLLQDMGFKRLCILPVVSMNNPIGVITLAGKGADCFSGNQAGSCAFAESVANETAAAIEHTRLFQKEFKSRQFMDRIIHQSPVGIAVFDKNGACVILNATCKKLFGIANDDQMIGKYNLFEDNELMKKGGAHIANKIFEGESVVMEIEYDASNVKHIQAKSGLKKLKIRAFPIADNDGSVYNIGVIYEGAATAQIALR